MSWGFLGQLDERRYVLKWGCIGAREESSADKVLPGSARGLEFKSPALTDGTCNPSPGRIPRIYWPTSLVKMVSSRFSKRPCLKN